MKKIALTTLVIISSFLLSNSFRSYTVEDELLKISKEYRTYNLYNSNDYWTLAMCEPMYGIGVKGDTMHMSLASDEKTPHGDKLYKFYVKDLDAYVKRNKLSKQPKGQVLIKEVWNVRWMDYYSDSVQQGLVNVKRSMVDGGLYTPTTVKQLFIMYKTKPSKENDEGWYYGIVDIENGTDKAEILEKGKINRCVKCHQQSKQDRIIGLND